MRKTITALLTIALLAGAFALPSAEAAKKKKKAKPRTFEGTYEMPAQGVAGLVGGCVGGQGCVGIPLLKNESFMQLEIQDQLGQDVYASVGQNVDGDQFTEIIANVCGATEEAIPVEPGFEVTVFVWEGPGTRPPCAGVSSSGKVIATLSATP